jgi:uncharacterized protein (DUF433 family)
MGLPRYYTREQAARLAQIRPDRLRRWERSGLFQSETAWDQNGRPPLYTFRDLVTLRALVLLRDRHHVAPRELRRVTEWLRRHRDLPLSAVRFSVSGRRVFFSDAVDQVTRAGAHPEQTAAHLDLAAIEADIARKAEVLGRRAPEASGRIVRHRGVVHAQPVFDETRIPVALVRRMIEEGRSPDEILALFPSLTRRDIDAARQWTSAGVA